MRTVLSAVLFLHGLIHVVGFVGPLELVPQAPFETLAFGRHLANTSIAARSLGMLWLLMALAFSAASVAVFVQASWWYPVTSLLLLASLLLCVTTWPAAKAGVIVNVVLLFVCLTFERARLWTDLLALLRVCGS